MGKIGGRGGKKLKYRERMNVEKKLQEKTRKQKNDLKKSKREKKIWGNRGLVS